jgi:hypothetical protein
MVAQDGLEWVEETFGLEPRWTREPDISKVESIARKHLKLEPNAPCAVEFHAQGAFNKLYKVETAAGSTLMRVTLPGDPFNKTNSEVATIKFVHENTDIPVPKIVAFDDSSENELGFEWILMEMLPGAPLRKKWRKLPTDAKQDLIKKIAEYQMQLFSRQFSGIGNIFLAPSPDSVSREDSPASQAVVTEGQQGDNLPVAGACSNSKKEAASSEVENSDHPEQSELLHEGTTINSTQDDPRTLPILGQVVSLIFLWGDHVTRNSQRGPFDNSEDWIRARLKLVLGDQEKIISTSDDEDYIEDAQDAKEIIERLLELLPSIFPPGECKPEHSVLFHDDLSMQDILVDESGKITGVIDWECVSAMPLWRACELPALLTGRDRQEEPVRDNYSPDNPEDASGQDERDALDNEEVNILYWEHLQEYELTGLRKIFLEEMRNRCPSWIQQFEENGDKSDYELAVQNCDNDLRFKTIKSWLDAREEGEVWSLKKKFLE